jgi:hypothetical protein
MKSNIRLGILPLFLLAVTAIRCSEDCDVTNTSYYYEPVYMSFSELRASVGSLEPIEISAPGKIYFKDDFIYINEVGKGIHVIDNTDPSSPQPKSFINIPGNFDLAIRNNILFADSYVDLVAIDISVVGEEKEVGRANNMFNYYSSLRFTADPIRGVVSDLREVKRVHSNDTECGTAWMPGGWRRFEDGMFLRADVSAKASSYSSPSGNTTGTAGSLARFAIREDQLYTLDAHRLKVVNVSDFQAMTNTKNIDIAWDIETIFPREDKLFIGSRSGMHIFDLTQPESPAKLSTYTHMRSCDPVVVEGDFAYVTLRGGTTCQGFINQLEVIDIKNLLAPKLVKTYPMTNPGGLGIDNGTLFICDGPDGLKVFDATDNLNITKVAQYKDLQAVDLIPLGGVAMVIGNNALYQYDYSDLKNIKLLSTLVISPNE